MCAPRDDPCGEADVLPEIDLVIADDHPVVLAGIEKTVENCPGCRVVGVAQSVGAQRCRVCRPADLEAAARA